MNTKAMKIEYEGYNYLVHHLYTDNNYGKKAVYHVLTNNPKWCASLIPELCGYPNIESKAEHDFNYKKCPTIENSLKPYYIVKFLEDRTYYDRYDIQAALDGFEVDTDSYYVFQYIEPYDD